MQEVKEELIDKAYTELDIRYFTRTSNLVIDQIEDQSEEFDVYDLRSAFEDIQEKSWIVGELVEKLGNLCDKADSEDQNEKI